MVSLTPTEVSDALDKLERKVPTYCWTQDNVRRYDVSDDPDFQTRYKDFYKVRRNADWRYQFYELMQAVKGKGIAFPRALCELRERTGRLEASFASKLVATVDPTEPVVDKIVLGHFKLRLPYYSARDRELKTVAMYNRLRHNYELLLSHPVGCMICEMFIDRYPWAEITDLKKIDLVLWQTRGN